jgi:hypothetical protein
MNYLINFGAITCLPCTLLPTTEICIESKVYRSARSLAQARAVKGMLAIGRVAAIKGK